MSAVNENIRKEECLVAEMIGCKYTMAFSYSTVVLHFSKKLVDIKSWVNVFYSGMIFDTSVGPMVYEDGMPVSMNTQ